MTMNHLRLLALSVSFYLAQTGCQSNAGPNPEDLETPLPKLTSAVQAEVRYPETPGPIPDDQLVPRAIKDKPELQAAFRGVKIVPWHDGRNVILLVCSPDGKHCWFEDASWTLGVDRRCYESTPLPPAQFTLINSVPRQPGSITTQPAATLPEPSTAPSP